MVAAIYRHGAPPTIDALAALLDVEAQESMWRTYVADIGCMLVRQRSKRIKLPFYSEIIARHNGSYDSRSGQEIVDSIITKRRKKRNKKAVNENETV